MNRWKSYVWVAAGVAALILGAAFTAKPLLAQVRAAFVENVDEPGRSPYTSNISLASCSGSLCSIAFDQVPAGKRLIATNLTGQVHVTTPGVIPFLTLTSFTLSGSPDTVVQVPTTLPAGVVDGSNMLGVNATLLAFFSAFSQPSVTITSTTPFTPGVGQLTLSGYLVDCNVSSSCAAIVH
jgi:hypothetical protein